MPTYNVHVFREMRLLFPGVEAATPEEAADVARGRPTGEAHAIEDCEGVDLAALVDVVGDEEYRQSKWINYPVQITGREVHGCGRDEMKPGDELDRARNHYEAETTSEGDQAQEGG